MSLCLVCQKTIRLVGAGGPPSSSSCSSRTFLPHHSSITNFLSAVNDACQFCWRGYRLLKQAAKLELDQLASKEALHPPADALKSPVAKASCYRTQLYWSLEGSETAGLPKLALGLQIHGLRLNSSFVNRVLFFIPTKELAQFRPCKALPSNTGIDAALSTVANWLNRCVSGHDKCRASEAPTGFRPTRLVDIEKHQGMFCVVAGSELPPAERYVTLSHRWRPGKQVLLTRENGNQLASGLPIEGLSTCFQDAVAVARYLGVRYLWIDCLCIIQNDDKHHDWETESGRMNEVYRNAYCNLSADYVSMDDGMFFERDPKFYSQVEVETPWESGQGTMHWTSVDKDMWEIEVNNSPLNSRGWVFQERMLAPRVIHFCRQEIFWECREKFYCESFPEELPAPDLFDLGDAISLRQSPSELWENSAWYGDDRFPVEDLPYEVWDDIVKTYTACRLTYPSDKLVAISGVARHSKSYLKDTYVAGMWHKYLSAELAWWVYPDREHYMLGEDPPYYAPSFSWAAVKGQINSSGPFAIGILVQVACVTLASGPRSGREDELFTEDVYGTSLRSPTFQIRATGRLRSVRLRMEGRWKLALANSAQPANQAESSPTACNETPAMDARVWPDFEVSNSDYEKFQAGIFYLMYWRYGPNPGDYDMSEAFLSCMLLSPVNEPHHQYRRVGWVMASNAEASIMLGDKLEKELPAHFNEQEGSHTIYII